VSASADSQDDLIEVLAATPTRSTKEKWASCEGRQNFRQKIERMKKTDKIYRSGV
jgi:hypothetical protein